MSSNIRITKVCQFCNNEFMAKTIKTRFCSLACESRDYKKRSRENKKEAERLQRELINNADIQRLGELDFLSIDEASIFIGISRRTLYRAISRKELKAGKFGSRTFIERSDIAQFVENMHQSCTDEGAERIFPGIENCYTMSEAQIKFKVSPSALCGILKRKGILKYNVGKFVYAAKRDLDELFNIERHE
ncbi:helix-turn-helix domain-containing protein [Flavobacterium procerum]|uniref:Helix-turn-helix domain-containing protein n=1 Tax=Flavobacterium procerum TaxID=1455569 RepID=A0ABV6BSG0_9FLAO